MQPEVPFVGLTGGMGAGKSTALQMLEGLGAQVLSTDAVVHELYGESQVKAAVVERWGAEVAPEGVVDRAAVAARAFAGGEQERKWLEGLLWPLVGARMGAWLEHARALRPAPKAAIVEVPLLFEAGMEGGFDATIAVIAQEDTRRARDATRGHVLAEERAGRQLSQEEKAARAGFVIHNDGSVADLRRELADVLAKLSR
ncbi:MAG TPA: dephospho-CoA kinase [Solirubrobacteraceae bacterium]|nr:dephospho-CoA kinase [Solirubrobacteraceae bacterium]